MDKEAAIRAFIVSLKVAFRNASIYNIEHPAFASGIDDLKNSLEDLFKFLLPLKIGFTPRSLYIDGMFYEKDKIYQELAKLFHFRKIKSLEIQQDISPDELTNFIAEISLPARDILRAGGPIAILEEKSIHNLSIEELEYKDLLKGEGKDIKEIWVRMMQDALEESNHERIMDLADSFAKVAKEFSPEEIAENRENRDTFQEFFAYLRKNEDQKFVECSKDFIKTFMRRRDRSSGEESFTRLRTMTRGLMSEDLALTFWEEILKDDSFDPLSLNVFSKFVDRDREGKVNFSIGKIFRSNENLNANLEVVDKLKDLLSGPDSDLVSGVYRNTLNTLLERLDWDRGLELDKTQLVRNYRFILFNLFRRQSQPPDALAFVQMILDQWDDIISERDFEFLKLLHEAIQARKDELAAYPAFRNLNHRIADFVEKSILDGDLSLYLDHFIGRLDKSTVDVNVYLDTIFSKGKVTPYILKAYFKFHTEYLFYFNLNLESNASDIGLIERLITSLEMIDSRISFVTLKTIFKHKHPRIKRKALQAMREITLYEKDFLLPLLRGRDTYLKAEALLMLSRDDELREKAMGRIFLIQSPFGIRNRRILEHIRMVEAKDIRASSSYLEILSQRKSFWNRSLREEAHRVLEKWNAG